jgi:hypothetical protein
MIFAWAGSCSLLTDARREEVRRHPPQRAVTLLRSVDLRRAGRRACDAAVPARFFVGELVTTRWGEATQLFDFPRAPAAGSAPSPVFALASYYGAGRRAYDATVPARFFGRAGRLRGRYPRPKWNGPGTWSLWSNQDRGR